MRKTFILIGTGFMAQQYYVFNKNIKAEAGFMAQTRQSGNRNQFQIVCFNNLPFKNTGNTK